MSDNGKPTTTKRVRDDDSDESPEAKRLRENLLEILDDTDTAGDRNPDAVGDLVSVMKSFEDELALPPPPPAVTSTDSGESQPDLGFLLEASDDDLGLPPNYFHEESVSVVSGPSDAVGFGQIWAFDDEIGSGYDAFDFGVREENKSKEEDVAFDGLFDCNDVFSVQPDFSYRPEYLPAA
eukprot:TRINITY_DN9647_c0_g1_i1.p1 TRINITY_DN9647_c0_g1~~TRINITY_DN9647_c0_g1_i1.p1  ORF type:complete len:180 (+),score=23.94 TRINITY_DN9647_c0_g1_i1:115-654(+)